MSKDWGRIMGQVYADLSPYPTGNPESLKKIETFGRDSFASSRISFSMTDVQACMNSDHIELSRPQSQPASESEELNKLVQIITSALPPWASPMSIHERAFVMGRCASGLIVHIEQTRECFVVFMELSTTTTKRWILMKTDNPFLLVKYVITLRSIMCDNYDKVREFLDDNK